MVKELRPGQVEDLYDTVSDCLGEQFDQVLGSLDEENRADALHLFTEKIASRYVRSNRPVAGTNPVLLAEPSLPDAIDFESKAENANVTREDQQEAPA